MGSLKFGSFPRSGSHFFTHLTGCEWLGHNIDALEKEQNVVVSIRNPLDCVPSWIVLTNDVRTNRAERVLEWYCAYYERCKQLPIVILPFGQLISDPQYCVDYAHKSFGLKPFGFLSYDLSTDFHYPTKRKIGYDVIIEEIKIAPSFCHASELFDELYENI